MFALKLEPIPGSIFNDTKAEAKRIAELLDVVVEYNFNGVMYWVSKYTDLDTIVMKPYKYRWH